MENYKSKIIPKEMKYNIDEILEQQLFNANRYYAESNPDISSLITRELYNSPIEYYSKLVSRWNWHNIFYENLLEPAYLDIIRNDDIELSPRELDDIISIFETSCLVDEATLVMSGGIKKYLDYNYPKIPIYGDCDKSHFYNLLLTPPVETFFAQYRIDHLFYIYLMKTNSNESNTQREKLLKKYHANDIDIFISRFNRDFKKYIDSNINCSEILSEIKEYYISSEYKVKHYYFTLGNDYKKYISKIIEYDNINEKLMGCNLIGISGFLLRKKILEYLDKSGVLKNDGFIYSLNKEIIIDSLNKLKGDRIINMEKNVKLYKQRGDTCAICCLMMLLEYYGISKANWYDEKRLYRIYKSEFLSGTPFSALAYHLSKNGLNTSIFHEDANLFNNDKNLLAESDFNNALDEYNSLLERAKTIGTIVKNGIVINSDLIRKKLEEGELVILAGCRNNYLHSIVVSGYDNDMFAICDPLSSKKEYITAEQLDNYMDTPIGKWFISVNDNSIKKEELLSNIQEFNDEASSFLDMNSNTMKRSKTL